MASKYSIETVFKMIDKYSDPTKRMKAVTKSFSKTIRTDFAKAQRSVAKFATNFKKKFVSSLKYGAVLGVGALGAGLAFAVKQASNMENVVAAFTPLMGGVEKATQLVDRLNIEAATTPFQFENIAASAKQLLPVMNGDIEKTAKTFRMLGDTAGGNAQKLDSITRGFTKAMLKGKVDMESLNMIAEAGVPIFTEMADTLGYSRDNLKPMFKEISKGTISTEMLTRVFERMTSEGGIFFKGMEISSKTLSGVWSTFKDNIAITAATIGQTLLPYIKELVSKGITIAGRILKWVQANKELIKTKVDFYIKNIINTIKIFIKIMITLYKILKSIYPLIIVMISVFLAYKATMLIAAVATGIFGAALNLLPIFAVITAISLLVLGIIWLVANWEKVSAWIVKTYEQFKILIAIFAPWLFTTIEAIKLVVKNWQLLVTFFKSFLSYTISGLKQVGSFIISFLITPIQMLFGMLSKIPGIGGKFKGVFDNLNQIQTKLFTNIESPVTQGDRMAYSKEEKISKGELTIKDNTGTAEMKKPMNNNFYNIKLQPSGAF